VRTAIIILALCALILLAFSPAWYPALTGKDEDISTKPIDASQTSPWLALHRA
jgi:hypothetical protein